jgi:MFS family permease
MASIPNPTGNAKARPGSITFGLIGFLFLLELTSGILQGYYIPLISTINAHLHIATAEYNWFEAAQLLLSAIVVPFLAKLGDMFGHKRILVISTILTGLATWALPFADGFWPYLIAFALQGFYVVWLPLEVALIFDKGRRSGRSASQTRRAAGFLVVALEAGAIAGALGGGRLIKVFHGNVELTLIVPAIAVTLVFFAVLFGVPESEPLPGRSLDAAGFVVLTLGLLLITASFVFLRITKGTEWWVWVIMAAGVLVFIPWTRLELRRPDPAVDIRVFRQPNMWPVQLTAGLIGISILGAQTPLSTFASSNPKTGVGLGLDPSDTSNVIGVYLVALIIGAVLFPILANRTTPRTAMIIAAFLVAAGYLDFLIFHSTLTETLINMIVAGLGSGALVGALPSTAAAAAPRGQTGIATGLTNTTKTIGGSFASSTFAIVLAASAIQFVGQKTATPTLGGYLTVFTICGCGALVAAILLFLVPKLAFADSLADGEAVITASASADRV